ncbi:phage tail domain-containing protein [Staphylococcus carnosus]|uniref:phage tail domain-containing protein n=1 Tax=Staphylococcus carnosus TaxID=1281 RepID=UPI0020A53089|nr:phage tail domain-containing protein [Staphylococcus carnosus]UTB80988.1 phage tail protein [Staphylococcus carnosus]
MINGKWIKLITKEETINITNTLSNCIFLDAKTEFPNSENENINVKGADGVLPSTTTFAPFNLVVRIGFDGQDEIDVNLFELKLRSLFYRRYPFHVVTSDNPGIKYPVLNPEIQEDVLDFSSTVYELTFSVYEGYSESLYKTDQYSLMSDKWQFESGVMPDADIKYKHTRQKFSIYNGSSDTINPRKRHQLQIWIRLKTTTGFKLVNKTTGDVFEYKGKLETNQSFLIDGAYPYIEKERCGRLTNHGLITLAPGYNDFEIWGSVSDFEIQFIFPFIYR